MAGELIPAPLVSSQGPLTISIAPVTRAAGGAGTAGTAVSLLAVIDEIREEYSVNTEDISPMGARGANNVRTKEDWTLTITEIIQSDITGKLSLQFFASTDYFKVIVLAGLMTVEYWGIRSGGGRTVVNGKSTFQMVLKRAETGQPNPLYSST